ncbi:hypothetical protein FQR65_LT08834 [Abscondita terminalis]|nr:hypothetical protein FQR65_LT08834 [Abscondita terminalis]
MNPVVEQITELGTFQLAEGPHWDCKTQSLYFADIMGMSVHKYVPSTKKHTQLNFDKRPSFIIPVKGQADSFVISLNLEIVLITWDGVSATPSSMKKIAVLDDVPEKSNNRINDGKADPLGNLWTGTMDIDNNLSTYMPLNGTFSCISNKKVTEHLTGVIISNGLAWSKDMKKFFYIDSGFRRIDQFDFDPKTATISNRTPLFTFSKHGIDGFPDGQTIDAEGNLWVAVFRGQRVLKIDSKNPETLLGSIQIPDYQVTSACFGGPNLDELYVTSAGFDGDTNESIKGGIYKVTGIGVSGLPGDEVKL